MDKPEIDFPDGPPPADLEIIDLVEGEGPEATAGSTVQVHYVGVAHSTGEEFDASYNRGEPLRFRLGVGQVISGWDAGVQGMKVGGRRQLVIPPHLGYGDRGYYMTALTFGNVHGVYKPGNVQLRPDVLRDAQAAVVKEFGLEEGSKPFHLVFHGGSGSTAEEIGAAVDYGVVKMNVDTDTQYAFTRPVAGHMFSNFDGVLKVDGEVGDKKSYDPRAWGKVAEAGMAARVVEACENLRSAGTSTTA